MDGARTNENGTARAAEAPTDETAGSVPEAVRTLDAALRTLRHGRFGMYGPWVRERFLSGLPVTVTATGYRVLRFVEASTPPPPTVSDIADLLLTDRARAVRVVDGLAGVGWSNVSTTPSTGASAAWRSPVPAAACSTQPPPPAPAGWPPPSPAGPHRTSPTWPHS
ncbi:hypothetical protein [Streptomyces sp. NPDC020917]|uniref:hypothetical protein n=1 Tax=Streptomyces sp. NPDC020917 TaxID=3365102 RepID=UPI00379E7A1F